MMSATARRPDDPTPEASADASPSCILLAEDDSEMRALIAAMLAGDGYLVIEARDGQELLVAIERLKAGSVRPAMVVSDVRMPGYSGLDLLAILRCASWTLPVVLITAFGDEDTHAEARELGAIAVLDKPFDLDDLRAVVRAAAPLR
jgi:DNA-binding response OmpR family regulator